MHERARVPAMPLFLSSAHEQMHLRGALARIQLHVFTYVRVTISCLFVISLCLLMTFVVSWLSKRSLLHIVVHCRMQL